ncbi:MAG TPA: hypothetical protein VKA94_10695 [Hyphomicrobiales bacterium]|nr:hypothetical protein [Hyphomicrobiales bacterium]
MKLFSLKLTVLALAGLLAASSGAQATGLYDADSIETFPNFSSSNDDDYEDYCDEHPYASRCDDYREERREERREYRHYKKRKAVSHRCAALIRAVGKRNLVKVFARNSARFAWNRETRAVHGRQYANWNNAENAHITCTLHGLLFSCTAKATPCKY